MNVHTELTDDLFDDVTREFYSAAAGTVSWLVPLNHLVAVFGLAAIHLLGVDKRVGCMLFSYEGGSSPPEWGIDYIRTYQHIDPRLEVVMTLPPMRWLACQEHFNDDYVAQSRFYQDFLIPIGGRYLFGCKLADDDAKQIFLGLIAGNGNPPLDTTQRQFAERLGHHVASALEMQDHLRHASERSAVGFELLSRMRQPILLLDAERNITFRNAAAQEVLDRGDLLVDHGGVLVCCDATCSVAMTMKIRELGLTSFNERVGAGNARAERRSLRLKNARTRAAAVVTLLALRPETTTRAFGPMAQAMVTIYEPGRMAEPDPYLLASTFDLTPAESRLAARLCGGATVQETAAEFVVSMNTIKSQLQSVFSKTGTNRQSDLVRMLITASTF